MRKVIASLFMSLDGVVESPDRWVFDSFDQELGAFMAETLAPIETVLLGRRSYEEWAAWWPAHPSEDDYGAFINPVEKLVFSRTLAAADWSNTTLVRGDAAAHVRRLREGAGGTIAVQASPTLARGLLEAGVLDELLLQIYPVVAGKGRRFFAEDGSAQRLSLADAKTTRTGVALLTYRTRP